jgi:hypothetical protein
MLATAALRTKPRQREPEDLGFDVSVDLEVGEMLVWVRRSREAWTRFYLETTGALPRCGTRCLAVAHGKHGQEQQDKEKSGRRSRD